MWEFFLPWSLCFKACIWGLQRVTFCHSLHRRIVSNKIKLRFTALIELFHSGLFHIYLCRHAKYLCRHAIYMCLLAAYVNVQNIIKTKSMLKSLVHMIINHVTIILLTLQIRYCVIKLPYSYLEDVFDKFSNIHIDIMILHAGIKNSMSTKLCYIGILT